MKNKNGFTLVEIIISIAIGSIVLMIAGSMLVSSFKFLFSTTDTDLDKRAVDSLIDIVRSDVEYSYDVRLVRANSDMAINDLTIENGWHSYYVQDNVLYRDSEELLDQSYYNKKNFELYANGNYENGVRVDFKYVLKNNDENAYSARDTIMFLNVTTDKKILDIGLYVGGEVPLTGEDDGYRLYFSDKCKTPSLSNNNGDGTVHDEIYNINITNYRGIFEEAKNYAFQYGEIVYYNGKYWKSVNSWGNNTTPGTNQQWKCLDSEYIGNSLSAYEVGDIVIYNDYYYEKINKSESWEPTINDTYYWKKLGSTSDQQVIDYVKNNTYDDVIVERKYKTVFDLLAPSTLKWYEPNPSDINTFNSSNTYKIGDLVKVKYKDYGSDKLDYYRVYINRSGEGKKEPPGNPSSGWTLLDYRYDSGSTYLKDDIVWRYGSEGTWNIYVQAIQDNFLGVGYNDTSYWKVLQ